MSIQAKVSLALLFNADGTSTSLSFDLRDIPTYARQPNGLGNLFAPTYDLAKGTSAFLIAVVEGMPNSENNITTNVTSSALSRHVLTVTFSTAPVAGEGFMLLDLLF